MPLLLIVAMWAGGCSPALDPEMEPTAEEPVRVRASVDVANVTIGDRISYSVEVAHEEGVTVRFPELPESLDGLRVQPGGEASEPRRRSGVVLERRTYRLVADGVGSRVVPSQEVAYEGEDGSSGAVATEEIEIEVASLLAAEEGEPTDIRDVKPLHEPRRSLAWIVIVAVAVLIAAAMLAWWWWRRRRRAQAETPVLPPYEAALQALSRLRETDFSDPEKLRAYYFALSETLRTYVEGRFGLNATDLTTEEILAGLGRLPELAEADAGRLRDFLDATDRVKFAKLFPSTRQIEETFETALSFVESTRPREPADGPEVAATPPDSPAGSGERRPAVGAMEEGA